MSLDANVADAALLAAIDASDPVPATVLDAAQAAFKRPNPYAALADDDPGASPLPTTAGDERPPSGCRWCGIGQRGHYRRFHGLAQWHGYVPPMQDQILARMAKRRRFNARRRAA